MNKLRSINTHFWADNYVIDLDPIEKLLFLYLLTNDQTNMLGVYELNLRRIAFDTGIDKEMVVKIFGRFEKAGKAKYVEGYVILAKFLKHQKMNPNMKKSAIDSFEELPEAVKQDRFMEPVVKGLEGFGRVSKGSEPIAEKEREIERETKLESETEPSPPAQNSAYDLPTEKEWINYCTNHGFLKEYAEYVYNQVSAIGWVNGSGNPIKDWRRFANMKHQYQYEFLEKLKKKTVDDSGLTAEELSL